MNLRKALMAASSLLFILPAFAEGDGYVRLVAVDGVNGFYKATWSDNNVTDPSTRYYLVTDKKVYKNKQYEDIPSRSFSFGEVNVKGGSGNFYAYYSVKFLNEGVVFAQGKSYLNVSDVIISGTARFTSPATAPFLFYGSSSRSPRGFTFADKVYADSKCGILAHSKGTNGFYVAFSGDASEYCGSVVVTSQYDKVGKPWSADLIFKGDASRFGGSVVLEDGATVKAEIDTSVGSLTLKKGSAIELTSETTLEVRDSLVIEENALIKLTGGPKSIVSELTRYALIVMPASSECSIGNFTIEDDSTSYYTKAKLELINSEDGETKTLYAVYFPAVDNILNNAPSKENPIPESAETEGKYWSDGNPVHSGAHYNINKLNGRSTYFYTRDAPDEVLSFAGESLTLDSYTYLCLRIRDFTVPYIKFAMAGVLGSSGVDHILRSKFHVTSQMLVEPRKSGSIKLIGPITGKETSKLVFRGESASTSQCRGTVELDGDTTGYPGKINVTLEYPDKLDFHHYFTSLIVRRADNLGGPRSAFAFDALQIDSGSRLEVLDSFELAEPTRGIFISSIGRILVAEDKELTVNQQLTVNGRFYKEGAGTLALGGDLRFLEFDTNIVEKVDEEGATKLVTNITSTVVETIPEAAANRTFYVMGGKVKPLTAYALDGLDVVFSNKTSKLDVGLALDIKSTDEELRAKGICNVKSPSPFAFLDDDAQKKAPIYLECDDETPATEYSFNVMTVKAECADALNLFKIVLPQSLTHLKLTTTKVADTDAGTVTLSAKLKKYGFAISIR